MRKLIAKLSCKSKPFIMDDTCDGRELAGSSQYAFKTRPMELMYPSLCMYLLTKEVAATVEFDDLIHALRTNECLVRIHIAGNFLTELSVMEQHLFWTVVCQAPSLRSIGFLDFNGPICLKTSVLKTILERREKHGQKGIQELEMSHVLFQGDLTQVTQALKAHSTLKSLSVWDVDHIDANRTNQVLQMLLDVPQLHNLFLGSFRLDEAQVAIIAQAVSKPDHHVQILRLIGGSKYSNNSHYHPMDGNRLSHKSCVALADMLKVNKTLLDLELTNLQLVEEGESGLMELIQALQHHNRTLKSFQLFQRNLFSRHDITPAENDALVAMLHDNPVLERCLPNGTGRAHDVVKFQLKMNRCKLRGIHVDVNLQRPNVLQVLDALNGDLDCLYHVLRENPSMMQL